MPLAIRLTETGGPDVLHATEIDAVAPGPNEVVIDHKAIGVNYLDITQRNGAVKIPLPSGLGLEAAGVVSAVGAGVTDFKVGDRVAYILGPVGAYSESRTISADRVVPLPDGVSFETAATVLFKGITAQYLLKSTYAVGQGTVVLLYGVGGALGQIMAPWAKHLGATVIGVVSKESSVDRARTLGCDDVLVWGQGDLAEKVAALTDGHKADVVYDGVGKLTFEASINSLRPRGLMVSFGASTGAPPPVEVGTLNAKGSLYLTRPGLAAHATEATEYRERAADVLDAAMTGVFSTTFWKEFPLREAAAAHEAIEIGRSAGPVILRP
ncbi:quinone oxidoreductase family protein [Mesorhizobium sp. A623]